MDENYFKSKFDWKMYVGKYGDLQKANIDTEEKAWTHAKKHGRKKKENRDIFNGDQKLLQDFRHFCSTGKVKNLNNQEITKMDENNILIVMPTYNRSENIEKSIEMINNQSYKNWTFLIIDDGSLETHKTKFKEIKEKHKNNNKLIFMENETNLQIAKTLNRGIQYLLDNNKFSHFTWISDDNIYYPNFIEELQNNNTYFSYSSWDIHQINNSTSTNNTQYNSFEDILNNFNGCASYMWTRDGISIIGFYTENINGCEDFEYLLRTFRFDSEICNFIKIPLVKYIRHKDSGMENNRDKIMNLKQEIINKYNHEKKKFNYPKLMFLYWDGSPLSYLNYLTIISFNYYNPNWKIIVYIPIQQTTKISWIGKEQKTKYEEKDYFNKLYEIKNVEIRKICLDTIGFDNNASEVIKSDYFRYYILEKYGGLWSDFDIIYTANIEEKMNFTENNVLFSCKCYDDPKNKKNEYYYWPIGLFLCKPRNKLFKFIKNKTNNYYNHNYYQCIGAAMWLDLFPTNKLKQSIDKLHKIDSVKICNEDYYLYWSWNELDEFLDPKGINNKLPINNIGVHWFNGACKSKHYANKLENRLKNFEINCFLDSLICKYINL